MSVFVERRRKAEDPRTKTPRKKHPFVERQYNYEAKKITHAILNRMDR